MVTSLKEPIKVAEYNSRKHCHTFAPKRANKSSKIQFTKRLPQVCKRVYRRLTSWFGSLANKSSRIQFTKRLPHVCKRVYRRLTSWFGNLNYSEPSQKAVLRRISPSSTPELFWTIPKGHPKRPCCAVSRTEVPQPGVSSAHYSEPPKKPCCAVSRPVVPPPGSAQLMWSKLVRQISNSRSGSTYWNSQQSLDRESNLSNELTARSGETYSSRTKLDPLLQVRVPARSGATEQNRISNPALTWRSKYAGLQVVKPIINVQIFRRCSEGTYKPGCESKKSTSFYTQEGSACMW